jgi:hypothetical protein
MPQRRRASRDPKNGNLPVGAPKGLQYYEPRCKVCCSPFREDIERMVLKGFTYMSIERMVKPLHDPASGKAPINRKNLAKHTTAHMELGKSVLRSIIEDNFKEAATQADETKKSILSHKAILEGMLQRAWEEIATKDSKFQWSELLAIMDRLDRMDSKYASAQLDEIMTEARAFSQAVQSVVPQHMFQQIADRFEENLARVKGEEERIVSIGPIEVVEESVA